MGKGQSELGVDLYSSDCLTISILPRFDVYDETNKLIDTTAHQYCNENAFNDLKRILLLPYCTHKRK